MKFVVYISPFVHDVHKSTVCFPHRLENKNYETSLLRGVGDHGHCCMCLFICFINCRIAVNTADIGQIAVRVQLAVVE